MPKSKIYSQATAGQETNSVIKLVAESVVAEPDLEPRGQILRQLAWLTQRAARDQPTISVLVAMSGISALVGQSIGS